MGVNGSMVVVEVDRNCIQCGYNLRGSPLAGKCPECGTDVARSMQGVLLQHASTEYQRSVESGLGLVLNGILVSIVLAVFNMALGIAGAPASLVLVGTALGLVPQVMLVLGYMRYTAPDPQFSGTELPDAARKLARIAVLVGAACALVQLLLQLGIIAGAGGAVGGAAGASGLSLILVGLIGLVSLLSLVAWAVQFFAVIKYTRWMAKRVPDGWIVDKTKLYIWLLPVLATVGALILIGPLIALVLYWNLHHRLRKQVQSIIATGSPAALKGALG